jgi:hypothetical protein
MVVYRSFPTSFPFFNRLWNAQLNCEREEEAEEAEKGLSAAATAAPSLVL